MTTHAASYSAEELAALPVLLPDYVHEVNGHLLPTHDREDLRLLILRFGSCFPDKVAAFVRGEELPARAAPRNAIEARYDHPTSASMFQQQ